MYRSIPREIRRKLTADEFNELLEMLSDEYSDGYEKGYSAGYADGGYE